MTDPTAIAGQVSISSQLHQQSISLRRSIDEHLFEALLHPITPEERAARRAEREAEWDAKTAQGLIPIQDDGEYEWFRVEYRGEYVEKWATADAWNRYTEALQALDDAREAL